MNNQDERGFPGTQGDDGQFDGGDTAAIVGNLIALGPEDARLSRDIFPTSLNLMRAALIRPDGLVRHPDPAKWYGQPDRFSRDQLIPILCSFVDGPIDSDVRQVFRFHERNHFLWAWNTRGNGAMDMPVKTPDLTGPEVWALWCRIRGRHLMWLWLLDLETLMGAIIWRFFTPKTNRICRNHMLVCITGLKKYPSVTMRVANWINNWDDLIERWRAHTEAVGEYPTAPLFKKAKKINGS